MRPKAFLFDYGGTLVEEVGIDVRAGNEWLLGRASQRPPGVGLDDVLARAKRISSEVVARRDAVQIETPWPALSRLIHGHFGIQFQDSIEDLELGFWQASVRTGPMPGVIDALARLAAADVPMAVVSNTSFSSRTLRFELDRHGLAHRMSFIMASSEYSVRKPNVLLFEMAATRLGLSPSEIWFVGDRLDTDVAGANAAGMTSVWLNAGANEMTADSRPSRIISSWGDLLSQFDSLR